MEQFPIINGELHIGGLPISQLAWRVGQTPFYAYDRELIGKRVKELRKELSDTIDIHYAMKANPMPAVVGLLANLVDGVDVASGGELKIALDAGTCPHEISFAGPGKQEKELRQAVAAGVLINIESQREAEKLAKISTEMNLPARVAIRVNPDFELKSSGMKMGGGSKPFGVDAEAVPQLLDVIESLNLAVEGFHLFAGSQNLNADSICEAQQQAYALAQRLAEQAPRPIRYLNLGGGFGIPYFPGENRLEIKPIMENLNSLAMRAKIDFPDAKLVIELGRYLVGEAGIFVTRIVDKKLSRGLTYLVVDGGLHHHLAASGNFGQVIRKNYPVTMGKQLELRKEIVNIVGPLCTPLDLLANQMSLPIATEGDLVVVFQSGAYGASASPQNFLSHPPVIEVLI
jgi:diaminopimelate decarboxylase